jgi:hypothetical protein
MEHQQAEVKVELTRLVSPHASAQDFAALKHFIDVCANNTVGI